MTLPFAIFAVVTESSASFEPETAPSPMSTAAIAPSLIRLESIGRSARLAFLSARLEMCSALRIRSTELFLPNAEGAAVSAMHRASAAIRRPRVVVMFRDSRDMAWDGDREGSLRPMIGRKPRFLRARAGIGRAEVVAAATRKELSPRERIPSA